MVWIYPCKGPPFTGKLSTDRLCFKNIPLLFAPFHTLHVQWDSGELTVSPCRTGTVGSALHSHDSGQGSTPLCFCNAFQDNTCKAFLPFWQNHVSIQLIPDVISRGPETTCALKCCQNICLLFGSANQLLCARTLIARAVSEKKRCNGPDALDSLIILFCVTFTVLNGN